MACIPLVARMRRRGVDQTVHSCIHHGQRTRLNRHLPITTLSCRRRVASAPGAMAREGAPRLSHTMSVTDQKSAARDPVADKVPEPIDAATRETITVLVVDDDRSTRESCASLLRSEGFNVSVAGRGYDALRLVRGGSVDILLLDLYLPRVSGLEVLTATREASPDTISIVMTGNPSVESSVTALRAGAWDYLPKPFSATHFEILVGRAAHAVLSRRKREASSEPPAHRLGGGFPLYGRSQAMRDVLALADKVSRTNASVFITGESGSGKEVIAQYIHHQSRRSGKPLVPLNCAAIPEALLESEMFGHVEGAFTGAVRDKPGLLEAADGGTLFLDELTELPLPTQAKLLRVLQDGVVRRVGSTKTDAVVDVRFIAATNRDVSRAVAEGQLRKDLYYRLRVVPIHLPALRERPEDIPVLAGEFLKEFWAVHRERDASIPTFGSGALDALVRAPWNGNVRELRNLIEHLVVLAEPGAEFGSGDIRFVDDHDGGDLAAQGDIWSNSIDTSMDYHTAREHVLSRFELDYLKRVVQAASGNISDAARMAGVDRTTLYRLMEKHDINRTSIPST